MKRKLLFLLPGLAIFGHTQLKAQWNTSGTTVRLSTTSRKVGIGVTSTNDKLQINSASNQNGLRVQINSITKLLVGSNGGVSAGSSSAAPTNGLFVNGDVAIGIPTPTSSGYKVNIVTKASTRGINVSNAFTGNEDRIGTYSYSVNNPGFGYGIQAYGGFYGTRSEGRGGNSTEGVTGVYGVATGVNGSCYGDRFGMLAEAGGGKNNYGIWAFTADQCGTAFNAAGFFSGDVYADNYYSTSDRKFKKDIAPLKNSMQQLMKLKPSAYQFKIAEYPKMGLTAGNHLGLIADEVKQVFPELVKETVSPAVYSEDKTLVTPSEKFESVNYIGLIPVLIASVQEQQKTIAELKATNEELKAANEEFKTRMTKLELSLGKTVSSATLSSAKLTQNNPNPFNQNTIINYYLPEQAGKAFMNISDMNGRVIKTVALTQKGTGQLVLDAKQLSVGTYQYSLNIGGKLVDTKKMILTK